MAEYKLPLLSRLAFHLQVLVPRRVQAQFWLATLEHLQEHHLRDVHHQGDGFQAMFNAVSEVRIENIKRYITERYLRGRIPGKEPTKPPGGVDI